MPDSFDVLAALGWRIVYVPDYDYQVTVVDGAGIVLVDPALDRQAAADCALDLIADAPARIS